MYNLLFVDDEPIVKVTMQKIISWDDTEFQLAGTANSGISALEYYRSYGADAIITDLQMPGMDGVNLISSLRAEGFTGPILALSNYSDFELVRGALTAGAFDYLLKVNLDAENLMQMLDRMKIIIDSTEQKTVDNQNKEILEKARNRDLDISELRNYILTGPDQDSVQDYTPEFKYLDLNSIFPASVCIIHMDKKTIADADSVQFIAAVASEVFEDISNKLILRIHRNELLCLISQDNLDTRKRSMEAKLSRIDKQISVFASAKPAIMYMANAASITELRRFYTIYSDKKQRLYEDLSVSPLAIDIGISATFDKTCRREINDAIIYMERNFNTRLKLDDIASHVNLSREYLCRLFKSETGTSLFQYLENIRMKKAAEIILSHPDIMMKEVSNAIGIDNPLFFSKKFKSFFGISPTQYYDAQQKKDM